MPPTAILAGTLIADSVNNRARCTSSSALCRPLVRAEAGLKKLKKMTSTS